jgi:RNA polymerase sigma factor (TIGR02999 family)
MNEVTRILSAIEQGNDSAADQLLPLVYEELRKLATQKMAHERPGHTLQATALVHEAYLRLVDVETVQHWNSRGHFFGAAAEAMQRILVENARRKQRSKHGGAQHRVSLSDTLSTEYSDDGELLALDEALARFAAEEPAKAQLVKLRYFAGLSLTEAAEAMGISYATAKRYWTYARAWLYAEIDEEDDEGPS